MYKIQDERCRTIKTVFQYLDIHDFGKLIDKIYFLRV